MASLVGRKLGIALLSAAALLGCTGKSESDLMASARERLAKRDHAGATIELKTVLQTDPNAAEARYLLGLALLEQGDHAAALVELGKADDANFNPELLAPKLARAWIAGGKFKEVLQTYGDLTLTSPSAQAELRTAVAIAHIRMNNQSQAEAALRAALIADPNLPWALLTKARLEAVAGKFADALSLIDRAIIPGQPNGEAHLLRGLILRNASNDLEGAIKAYQSASEDARHVVEARGALIQIHLMQGRVPKAKAELAALQKSHPKSPATHYLDALVAYAQKDFVRAEAITEGLLRVMPNSPNVLILGGASSLQRGSLIGAEAKLGKVVQTVERVPVARKMLGETYLRMGQPEKALAALRPLVEQARPDADAMALAGQAHLMAGQAREAEAMFAAAATLKPDDAKIRTALALTDLVKGNAQAAFDALQEIAVKDVGETADLALISAHLRRGEADAALRAIDKLQQKFPDKPTALHLRGVALRAKGDLPGARAAFEGALKIEPKHFAAVAALVGLDVQENKLDAARQRIDAAVIGNPQNVQARIALFNVMARQGAKPDQLLGAIDDAIKANPGEAAPRVAKITQLSTTKDISGAAAAAQQALAALPQHPDVLDAAGRALANAGDYQQAISAFNKLVNAAPRSPQPYFRLADLHARRGDQAAVSSSLARAFEVAPESPEVHQRLLAQAVRTRDFRPALAAAKELQTRFRESAAGHLLQGDIESARKAWPVAQAAYRGALGKPDAAGRPQVRLYGALMAAGDKAGAERFASEWVRAHPQDTRLLEYLGLVAFNQKDYALAERRFLEVLAIEPRHQAALNNLAWVLAERGAAGAVETAERAAAASGNAPPVLDTLAKALASEGKMERAIEVQKQALAAMPDRHQFRLNLAGLYIRAGNRTEAAAELETLSKLGDKFPYQTEVGQLKKSLPR